jgi:hypothetical protein
MTLASSSSASTRRFCPDGLLATVSVAVDETEDDVQQTAPLPSKHMLKTLSVFTLLP